MKFMLVLLTVGALLGGFNNIATINRLKQEAEAALQQKEYAKAAQYYSRLVDSLQVTDEAVRLNLAHSLLLAGDTATAQKNYGLLASSENGSIKSVAYQQVGVVASAQKKYEEALATFKESLKADPTNEESRYNYELVKKLLEQQQEQQQNQEDQQQNEDKNQQSQDQKNDQQQEGDKQEQQDQEGEKSEQEGEEDQQSDKSESQDPSEREAQEGEQNEGEKEQEEPSVSPTAEKLKEMNISEEKARMILEAMRNNEMQYIQQNRRKPQKPRDRTKPDW